MHRLTKSKFISGLRCSKKLWLDVHDREPYVEAEPGSVLDIGNRVGRFAHGLCPGGVEIEAAPWEYKRAVADTRELMADPTVPAIFEAAFEHDNIHIRVDILERLEDGAWGLREVKASLSVKEESKHCDDLAVQLYVLRGSGLAVSSAELIHIDRAYVHDGGDIDPVQFLRREELIVDINERLVYVGPEVASQHEVLARDAAPEVYPFKAMCTKPWKCDHWKRCTADKPDDWISILPRITRRQMESLIDQGVESIRAIPDDFHLNGMQQTSREVITTGEPYVSEDLGESLRDLGPPAFYLDFETFAPMIPIYPGTAPHEQIPFQWSIHYCDGAKEPRHWEYLASGHDDPRRELAERMIEILGDSDTPILAYNMTFERGIIQDLARLLPDLAEPLEQLIGRLGDPLPIVRTYTYFPGYKGSFSLKTVGPTLTSDLEYGQDDGIAAGNEASTAFWRIVNHDYIDGEDEEGLRQRLLDYCKLDTEMLRRIHQRLIELAN